MRSFSHHEGRSRKVAPTFPRLNALSAPESKNAAHEVQYVGYIHSPPVIAFPVYQDY